MHARAAANVPEGFELVPCPACGDASSTVTHQGRDWILNSDVTMQVVKCDGCGLHYTNPRPRVEHLGKYYENGYAPHQSERESDTLDGVKGLVLRDAFGAPSMRARGAGRALARAVSLIKRPESFGFGVPYHGRGRLLDFGCGAGKFLRRMHALGWDVTGVDFSDAAVSAVRASGLKAFQGTLPQPELPAGSFDVVTMRHSLEHVPDPLPVLRAARELLAPGGRLLVQVPNYASWEVDYFGDASPRLDIPRHLTHFTPATLAAMLVRAGFANPQARQVCRSNWIGKAALVSERGPKRRFGGVFRNAFACRIAAKLSEMRGRGNEIIATADKS
jgi:2-polyprenyl-3-methyl-5-hydroxy-6-metoxy-1,4-benzoquinol methylase